MVVATACRARAIAILDGVGGCARSRAARMAAPAMARALPGSAAATLDTRAPTVRSTSTVASVRMAAQRVVCAQTACARAMSATGKSSRAQAASPTSLHFPLILSHPSTSSVQGHRLLDRSRPVPEQLLGPRHLRRRPVQMQAGLRGRVVQRAPPRVHLSKRLLGCGRVPEGSVLLPAGL